MLLAALRLSAALFLLLITLADNQAQRRASAAPVPGQIHGSVRFSKGGAPAENVLVRLEGIGSGLFREQLTDRQGKFRFADLPRDQYRLTAHSPGFTDTQQNVDLKTAMSQLVLLQLAPEAVSRERPATGVVDAGTPAEAQRELERARAALEEGGRLKAALQHLERAVALHPGFLEAQLLLGTVYMDDGQWENAERALLRVLEISRATAPALFALGEIRLRQKLYDEAEKLLLEGLKLDERSWQAHLALGRVYWSRGEIGKAGPHVGRTIQLNPTLAEAHLLAGDILLRARKAEDALAEFEEYLRLAPDGQFSERTRLLVQKLRRALLEKKD
jgi:Tfp pilus assembly protein PilF